MNRRKARGLMLAMVLAAAVSAIAASSASAVLVRLPNGGYASYQPLRQAAARMHRFDTVFTNMDYNGGAIMPSNTDYLIFWSPRGLSAYPPEYPVGLAQYFKDLQHDNGGHQNVDSVATQYNDLTGASVHYRVTYGGSIVDTDPYPASKCPVNAPVTNCLTDHQMQVEIEKVAAANHLPRDREHEFFLLTPRHVENCFNDDPNASPPYGACSAGIQPQSLAFYCAYHQNTSIAPMLFYSIDPYVTENPGCDDGNHPNGPSDGALVGGLSHEHNESITDPIPNDAWTNGAGRNQGQEVGDQCNGINGPPLGIHNGSPYNQVINGHYYWYQEEWSNAGHQCLQRYTPSDTKPTASETVTANGGTSMTFDASASSASPFIAFYSWQFNDAFAAQTVEQPTPSITHTFPEPASYSTGLAVYAPSGLATGTGGIVTTGHDGFTPAFTASTSGQTVSFHALKVISRKPVLNTMWEFGDGTTGSGSSPTHTYAAPGTYKVTVVLFSGVGSAYPGAGAGPVYAHDVTVGAPPS